MGPQSALLETEILLIAYSPTLADAHGSEAEAAVFNALQRDLPDEFFCYHFKHLLKLGQKRAVEGEIDSSNVNP